MDGSDFYAVFGGKALRFFEGDGGEIDGGDFETLFRKINAVAPFAVGQAEYGAGFQFVGISGQKPVRFRAVDQFIC